jgi:hypothetical protein
MVFGTNSNYQLQDNLDLATGSLTGTTMNLTGGTLDINGKTVTTLSFSTNSATSRVLALGTNGTINVVGNGINVWQAPTASNFSYTGTGSINFTYSGSTGTRTISHGSSSGGSSTTKAPPFFITAGTDIIATTANGAFTSLDFTGFTGTLTNTARNMYGNLTLGSGMTATGGANATTFASTTGVMTLISNGVTTDFSIGMSGVGGTFLLTEPLVISARTLTLSGGTIDCNDFDATVGIFSSTGGLVKTLDISNTTVTLNAGGGNLWNAFNATNLTLTSANSTIIANNASGNPTLYLGNGVAYDNVVFAGAGISTIYPSGNVTVNTLTSTQSGNRTFVFNGDANNYTTINNWNIVGDAGNTVSLTSDNGSQFNLVYGGNSNVNVSYHTITNSVASPANTWYALFTNNNSNGGNNSGWIFTLPATTSSNFFLVF